MRQVVLDTETTGLETSRGHRIIEIGCVEIIDRKVTDNSWHYYINPQRAVDIGAFEVHGISDDFLLDKPLFGEISTDFVDYIRGAELVIHNAPFDVGFLNHELKLLDLSITVESVCSVLDTLVMARQKHPGQKNNLDALCKRYGIDNSQRSLHGALLDARILADVYLEMTGGQTELSLEQAEIRNEYDADTSQQVIVRDNPLPVWRGDAGSEQANQAYIEFLAEKCENPVWR